MFRACGGSVSTHPFPYHRVVVVKMFFSMVQVNDVTTKFQKDKRKRADKAEKK
jgi:hypothetical protein